MRPPRVRLTRDLARHVRAGHPWIYADALAPSDAATGSVVDVVGSDGKFLARGLYDAGSPLAVRVFTLDPDEAVDGALVYRRVAEALAARRGAIDARETDAFRWVNGEGDFLPGVVVDLYAGVAVLRLDGEAARSLRDHVVAAVVEIGRSLGVSHVHERSRGARGEALHGGMPPSIVEVREAGVRFAVDVLHGQKTGTFLDQRENRRAIRPYASGVEVANLFAYSGGFSVNAALGGATRVVSVDSAKAALDGARINFALNGLDPERHEFACTDAFEWLARARDEGRRFGLVIVDPPSFAPSEKAVPKALAAYRDLHAAALAVVAPSGVLAAASCSSHVGAEAFLGTLREGAHKARRSLRVLEVRGQPADHPSLPAFPEGRYLKMIIARARPV
ncbi:MAG: class I SAM-dependent rRNA methyltransferase [Myxococcales bacterium]|nr:class I SAM-dependent rRNA methyltransferase [Myxococcales bacterium]